MTKTVKRRGTAPIFFSIALALVFILAYGCTKNNNQPAITVTDIDGNIYHTVTIGTQVWMIENLKVTKYKDGTPIPFVSDNAAWSSLTSAGYCWYDNDESTYKNTYGALYNWSAANSSKLCPAGWHVPTDAEWSELIINLGTESIAGGQLKEKGTAHWLSPNTGATNDSGFSALPGGWRDSYGSFGLIGGFGYYWSTTENGGSVSSRELNSNGPEVFFKGTLYKQNGFSVRCLKD